MGKGWLCSSDASVSGKPRSPAAHGSEDAQGAARRIHFQNHHYMDPTLASFVKEEVMIRFDHADMGEIHVFYQDRFLCRAVCAELSDRKVTLKEIEKARSERRNQVRVELKTCEALVNQCIEIHHAPSPAPKTVVMEPAPVEARPRLKRYVNDYSRVPKD